MTYQETQLTLVCYKCRHKFNFAIQPGPDPKIIYSDEAAPTPQPIEFIFPKFYILPCPQCRQENEIML